MKDGGSKRVAALETALKGVGAKLDAFYVALPASTNVYAIIDAPDLASVSALALATNASGAFVRVSTTVLVTPQEVDAAAKKTVQVHAAWPVTGSGTRHSYRCRVRLSPDPESA